MKKRIFVTGSGGMVGHYIEHVFGDFELILTDIERDYIKLDVRDGKKTGELIREARPDFVLHLAAATDVDRCEKNENWAYECNKDGARNVALACKKSGALMLHVSTGSVFSGKLNRPARETDMPDPVNIYGKSKLAGEEEVKSILNKYYIIRAGWMMGGGPEKDKKFIGKIMRKILSGEKDFKVINDKFGTPIYAKDLLYGIKKLLPVGDFGFYHIVNKNTNKNGCSRFDMAMIIKEVLKDKNLKIETASSGIFDLYAPRARSEELENLRLKEIDLDSMMRPWQEALKEYLIEEWMM